MSVQLTATDKGSYVEVDWATPPWQRGYVPTIDGSETLTDGKRHPSVSTTARSVKIGKPADGKPHAYGVNLLGVEDGGSVTLPTPAISGWPASPWPTGSVWNPSPIPTDAKTDPNSAAFVQRFLATVKTPKFVIGPWSVPVVQVKQSDPSYAIQVVPDGHGPSDINRLGPVPIPHGTKPDPGGDGHLCLIDYDRLLEWDMWRARYDATADTWTCTSGAVLEISKGQIAAALGIAGGDTANLPLSAGLVKPEEIRDGRIDHPLVFAANNIVGPTGKVFRWPANYSYGAYSGGDGICGGMRFQLDPLLDVSFLAGWQRTVAVALQTYGAYVRDQTGGTDADFYAENTLNRTAAPSWSSLGIGGNTLFGTNFPWSHLRVIA